MQQPTRGLFRNLTTLRIGIQNVTSFISHTVTSLSLLFTPDIFLQDRRAMSGVMKHLQTNLPNVDTLAITGGERIARYGHYIIRIIFGLKRLRHVTLCPSAYTFPVFKALSRSRTITSIHVMEYDKIFSRSKFRASESALGKSGNITTLPRGAFQQLQELDITLDTCDELVHLIQNDSFPSSRLAKLWARFTAGHAQSALSISSVSRIIAERCRLLQKLTLRLGPFQHATAELAQHAEPVSLDHFLAVFDLPLLTEFAIDHSLPIVFSDQDIEILADRSSVLEVLWLNPFPVTRSDHRGEIRIPDITILDILASKCHHLKRLGILIDARTTHVKRLPQNRFPALRELFLGSSELPEVPDVSHSRLPVWEEIAVYLFMVLPHFTEFTTSREYNSLSLLASPPVSSYMRPAFVSLYEEKLRLGSYICSWVAVLGIRRWLRSQFISDRTYRSPLYD